MSEWDDWAGQVERHSERDWSEHLRIQLAAEVEKVNKLQEQLGELRFVMSQTESQLRQQLAAERERRETAEINRDAWRQDAAKFSDQLAAERENCKSWYEHAVRAEEELAAERETVSKQLAAEREQWQLAEEESHRIIHRKNEQLAAAVEALKWLDEFVVEPEYFPGEGDRQWWQEKRAALAKLEKQMK